MSNKQIGLGRLSSSENLVLGVSAGVASKLCNYPLLVNKNLTQQGLPLCFNPRTVYRGLPVACLNIGTTTGVQFFLTGVILKMIQSNPKNSTPSEKMIGSAAAGALSGIPCSIWELTMIQQQRFGGSLLGTPARMAASHGISTLLRGSITAMGRESMFTMGMLGITPNIQQALAESSGLNPSVATGVGALCGAFFCATITHPMDTIKTCMQGDIEQKKYTNIRATGTLLTQEYGVRQGLFKGLAWRMSLIATTFFLVNEAKGLLLPVLFPHHVN
jgi:solute carrier family 25 carnitine/acylcarnitine transporter 20/29